MNQVNITEKILVFGLENCDILKNFYHLYESHLRSCLEITALLKDFKQNGYVHVSVITVPKWPFLPPASLSHILEQIGKTWN